MITKLSLENWKSHSKSEFSFGKGTNILVGRMGSGKSSVLDALCFALYGTFPKMSRRDQTTENLVNLSSGAEIAKVELEFEKGGKKYAIMRKIGKKASDAEARCEGKLVQKGPKQVTEYIISMLGVDYELFTRAIYSEQNRIDYLLSLNPRARKGEIDWLLGLGQFDEAREAAQAAQGKLSEQSSMLSSPADESRLAEIGSRIGEQQHALSEKKSAQEKLLLEAEKARQEHDGKQKALSALEKLQKEYRTKKSECERAEGAVMRLKKETAGKKKPAEGEIEKLSEGHAAAQQAVLSAKQEERQAQTDVSNLKSEIAILENGKKLAEARAKKAGELSGKVRGILSGKSVTDLDSEAALLKDEIEKLTSLHAKLHAEIAELTSAVETLSGAGAKCPVCDSDLSGGKAEMLSGGKQSEIKLKKAALDATGTELREKKALLSSLERKANDLSLFNAELARLGAEGVDVSQFTDEISKKKSALAKSEERLKKAGASLASLEKGMDAARQALEDARRAAKLFSDLEGAALQLSQAQEALSKLEFSEEKYEMKRKGAEEARTSLARLEAEAAGQQSQVRLVTELLASLQKEFEIISEKRKTAKKYAEAAESMAIYKNSLVAAQSELRATLVEEINAALAEIWPSVYPYADYRGVKIEADEKDYRLLMQKEGWREVDSVASGGERACLCLALRIAFATVLTPDIGWLILDEPTHNLDSEAVQLLSEAINEKIPSIVEQTFVITHDTALGETGEGLVYRLERDKGKNESTRVEKPG
ncbi:DNA double-strand break repair Rad50 ATPase [uncultured archaeon]|nr:DNA double-strand break repair Rad50 ATPase [uncultured archaeon]